MRRHRVDWCYLLWVGVYLPSVQLTLPSVRAWHISDTGPCNDDGTSNDDDATSNDNDHEQYVWTGGVQALLRTELGQLVIQVHLGLLWRVSRMCNDNHRQHYFGDRHDDHSNLHGYNNQHNRPTYFHDAAATGLQALVPK